MVKEKTGAPISRPRNPERGKRLSEGELYNGGNWMSSLPPETEDTHYYLPGYQVRNGRRHRNKGRLTPQYTSVKRGGGKEEPGETGWGLQSPISHQSYGGG